MCALPLFVVWPHVPIIATSRSIDDAVVSQLWSQHCFHVFCLILGLNFVLPASTAFAYCPSYPRASEEFKSSSIVFVGRVMSKEELPEPGEFIAATIYTVHVKEVLKGKPSKLTKLFSENTTGRFPMKIGASYLIFASPETFANLKLPQLAVNNCGKSGKLRGAGKALDVARRLSAGLNATRRE